MITIETYNKINNFLELQSISLMQHELMQHENKNSTRTRFPISNFTLFPSSNGLEYYSISTNHFLAIIHDDLLTNAIKENSHKFGTKNAKDVISELLTSCENYLPVIYEIYKGRQEGYLNFLKDTHSYIIANDKGELNVEVLRIDLFRKVEVSKDKSTNFDFTGGLFHAFKHFSINGINLSTGNEKKVELYHPIRIIDFAIKAFFQSKRIKHDKGFNSEVNFDTNYNLLFTFYYEKETKTYFITTIRKAKQC
jgi:hypothetical protein